MTSEHGESDYAIAKAWIELHRDGMHPSEKEAYYWAHLSLDDIRYSDHERFWRIINEIQNLDNSDSTLSNLAAGPLEDLLASAGAEFIDRIEARAAADECFRKILGMVWKNSMPDQIWARIERAASQD